MAFKTVSIVPVAVDEKLPRKHSATITMLHHGASVLKMIINIEFEPHVAQHLIIKFTVLSYQIRFCLWQSNGFLLAAFPLTPYSLVTRIWWMPSRNIKYQKALKAQAYLCLNESEQQLSVLHLAPNQWTAQCKSWLKMAHHLQVSCRKDDLQAKWSEEKRFYEAVMVELSF